MKSVVSSMANECALTTGPSLKSKLAKAERLNKAKSLLLILPLAIFLFFTFAVPIASLLARSVNNPEIVHGMPRTVAEMKKWSGTGTPSESTYQAILKDISEANDNQTLGELSKRLNIEVPGFRSLISNTARNLPLDVTSTTKQAMVNFDERWGQEKYWQAIKKNDSQLTSAYLLASLDHKIGVDGKIDKVAPEDAIYLDIFARTFLISTVVTIICSVLAIPLAYLLAKLPSRASNLLMIMVLLPFWTSVLVRVASWIVLLQSGGVINSILMKLGAIHSPLELVFNRFGVYVSMVHILLPFMILPIYSVMKNISPTYLKAAVSLGSHPFRAFWQVYFPQAVPGVAAGGLLVFILSIGYYITPALLGSANDQMVSYFVAFYTNTSINWGMATALGGLLFLATLILYVIYSWLVGASRLKLG